MVLSPNNPLTPESPAAIRILLLSDDLMFPSRVREAVRPLGHALRVVGTLPALESALQAELPSLLLVNLNGRRYDPIAAIRQTKSSDITKALPILAFAGHVEKEKHAAARDAGADMVAANSSVALHLPALLGRLLGGHNSPETVDLAGDDAGG